MLACFIQRYLSTPSSVVSEGVLQNVCQ